MTACTAGTHTVSPQPPASASPQPTASAVGAGGNCQPLLDGAKPVRFGSNGNDLAGDEWGNGEVGVVFAHEADIDSCSWIPYAKGLAGMGYRALTFDFAGFGGSGTTPRDDLPDEVAAAATFLRSEGATKIVLIGASMGGTAVVAAAPQIVPPVTAIVSLSGPESYGSANAVGNAPKITQPLLVICAAMDGDFVPSAHSIYEAAKKSSHRQLSIIPDTSLHGYRLVDPNGLPEQQAVDDLRNFLRTYAPPTA
jgi:dienelactone hydrolase